MLHRSKTQLRLAVLAAASLGVATPAAAAIVPEVEANDTLGTAQPLLAPAFTLEADADIEQSTVIPHATVEGSLASTTFDWFSFSVASGGSLGIFDLDYAWNDGTNPSDAFFDGFLDLFDSAGTRLLWNDDFSNAAGGSGSENAQGLDPYLQYTFASAGTYFIRVGICCGSSGDGLLGYDPNDAPPGTIGIAPQFPAGAYELQVSLASPGAGAVPEPSTWAMMLLGFGGVGFAMRRRPSPVKAHSPA